MNLSKKLQKLLDNYINENEQLEIDYKQKLSKKIIYEELIKYLKDNYNNLLNIEEIIRILLNKIYDNNDYIEKLQSILLQENLDLETLKQIINDTIINDYHVLQEDIELLKLELIDSSRLVSSARRVKSNLKHQKTIDESNKDIENINNILKELEYQGIITNQEYLLLINELEHYNERILTINGNPDDVLAFEESYNEVPTILSIGFQEHDKIELFHSIKAKMDIQAYEILNQLDNKEENEIIAIIESYIKESLEEDECKYLIIKLLDIYQQELISSYKLLIDKDIYNDKQSKKEVIKEYCLNLEKYITIKNYFELKFNQEKNNEKPILNPQNEKRLIYTHSKSNNQKAKILSDIHHDASYEYYEEIYELIVKFKNGTLGNNKIKTIQKGNKSSGYIELKDDNIRIILRRIKDNIYCVLGLLIKKANNDMSTYRTITDRKIPDISTNEQLQIQLDLASLTEEELERLVREKSRKNGRKWLKYRYIL